MGPLHSYYCTLRLLPAVVFMREAFDGWHNSQVFCSLRQNLSKQRLCRLKDSQQLTARVLANAPRAV